MTRTNVKRTADERARISEGARAHHDVAIEQNHQKIRQAMSLMQQEIATNGGIYPQNKGVPSQAEVARRAELHPVTLHKPHYSELRKEIKTWVEKIKGGAIVGSQRIRKTLKTRLDDWKELYEDMKEAHHLHETDLQVALARMKELEAENATLRARLSELAPLKVVPLKAKTSKKD
jgi:hypothetical protein